MKTRLLGSAFIGLTFLLLFAFRTSAAWGLERGFGGPEEGIPKPLGPALISAIQQNASKHYDLVDAGSTYLGPNRRVGMLTQFSADGLVVRRESCVDAEQPAWELQLRLRRYGYDGRMQAVSERDRYASGNRFEYRHRHGRADADPALVEWYLNGPLGLEQGFDLPEPPPRPTSRLATAKLRFELTAEGDLTPAVRNNGRGIQLADAGGNPVLEYGALYAYDSRGRELPSRLLVDTSLIVIEVDDRAAVYPITVDPLLTTETIMTASDAAAGDQLGLSVAISKNGQVVVAGALFDDDLGNNSGSAYVFRRNAAGMILETKLTASDGMAEDRFGHEVAVGAGGGAVFVGASLGDAGAVADTGAVYLYERNAAGVITETKLTASDAAATDNFGTALALSDGTLVVGAFGNDDAGTNSGSVYLFRRNAAGVIVERKLTASDAASGDNFGASVAIDGTTVVVGAELDDDGGVNSGSAYVYQPDSVGGLIETKLTASDTAVGDNFGGAVALHNGTLVVGAVGKADAGSLSGAAYIYRRDAAGVIVETKVTAGDAAMFDNFGNDVAISGDMIVVGAPFKDDAGTSSGAAYIYEPDGAGGLTEQKLTASDAVAFGQFGFSVAINGTTAVVGAPGDAGAVYVYTP